MSFDRIQSSLESIGLSKQYLSVFQQRRINDASVNTVLRYPSLTSALSTVIPVQEHLDKFIVSFKNEPQSSKPNVIDVDKLKGSAEAKAESSPGPDGKQKEIIFPSSNLQYGGSTSEKSFTPPISNIIKAKFNESLKFTGAPDLEPATKTQTISDDNDEDDFKTLLNIMNSVTTPQMAVAANMNEPSTPSNQRSPPLSQSPLQQGIFQNQNHNQIARICTILNECVARYHEGRKLFIQTANQKPFALDNELQYAHAIAQEWALDYLQQELQKGRFVEQFQIKSLLTQRIMDSFNLSCAQNYKTQTDILRDATSLLEMHFKTTMKEEMTKKCNVTDSDHPNFFVMPDTFKTIAEQCQNGSLTYFKRFLNLRDDAKLSEVFPLAKEIFEKSISFSMQTMQLFNKVRKLEAEIKLRDDIVKYSENFKSQLELKIKEFKYWTPQQLKNQEGIARIIVNNSFYESYNKSLLHKQGVDLLQKSLENNLKDVRNLVEILNEKYLVSCAHLISDQAINYANELQQLNVSKSTAKDNTREERSQLKIKCLNILSNHVDFNRLPTEDAARFMQDLASRIDTLSDLFPEPIKTPDPFPDRDITHSNQNKSYPGATAINYPHFNPSAETGGNKYNHSYDSFTYTIHDFKPTPTVGRAGGFYVEESELRSCIQNEMLGTSVLDVYASIISELYPNDRIAYVSCSAVCFTGNQWRVAQYIDDMVNDLKQSTPPTMTTVATIVTAGWHWMLFVCDSVMGEIRVADTLGGFCNPKKLMDGVDLLVKRILDDIFGKRKWNTRYFGGIVKQDDGHSCGPAALYYLEKLYRSLEIKCDDVKEYQRHRKTIVERILQTTDEGNKILQGQNMYTQFLTK